MSHWLRPDAPASDERLFCHVYGRWDRRSDQFVPGWPYFFVAALERGRTPWGALLDVRLGQPAPDRAAGDPAGHGGVLTPGPPGTPPTSPPPPAPPATAPPSRSPGTGCTPNPPTATPGPTTPTRNCRS
ncbi:transposase [Streptomyces sp. NPDC055663]